MKRSLRRALPFPEFPSAAAAEHPGTEQAGSPACIYTLDPREAFVIYYSGYTKKPMAGVLTQYDENDAKYYGVYTDSEYFEIKSGKITRQSGHLYGSVPIVEYPNNSARMGAFEVVLPLLNGINTLESNRVDNVQDFVNAYDVFQNVDLEDGQYSQHGIKHPGKIAAYQQGQPKVGANGKKIAVREVDKLQHAVHHRVPQGHQGIDAAHGKTVQKLL